MTATKIPSEPTGKRSPLGIVPIIVLAVLGLLAVLVVVTVLGGLAWFSTGSGQDEPRPATSQVPAVAIPDGETFAYVTEVADGSLTADPALLLSGDEARQAAVADGVIAPGEDLPNDFYIDNPEPGPLSIGAADDVDVTVLIFDSSGAITETDITLADLAVAFTGDYPGVAIYGLVAGEFPVTLTVENGIVVDVEQVYLP